MKEITYEDDNLEIIDLMKRIRRFELFSETDLQSFIRMVKLREYSEGEVLIKEGDYDGWVFFLIYGFLEIIKDGKAIGTLQRNGDLFGEMGVIDGSPRSASIKAVKKSLILGMDASLVDRKVKANDTLFCYTLYRIFGEVLSSRLRQTTEENIRLKEEIASLKQTVYI